MVCRRQEEQGSKKRGGIPGDLEQLKARELNSYQMKVGWCFSVVVCLFLNLIFVSYV